MDFDHTKAVAPTTAPRRRRVADAPSPAFENEREAALRQVQRVAGNRGLNELLAGRQSDAQAHSPGPITLQRLLATRPSYLDELLDTGAVIDAAALKATPATPAPASIQRLQSSKAFTKAAQLGWARSGGGSDDEIAGIAARLQVYETAYNWSAEQKAGHLIALHEYIGGWLSGKGKKSSRRKAVIKLDAGVTARIRELSSESMHQPVPSGADAVPKSAAKAKPAPELTGGHETGWKSGGQLSEVIGVDFPMDGEEKAVFEGVFKSQPDRKAKGVPQLPRRARGAGITADNENLVGRNLASYAVAVRLGANVITPTFQATHADKAGIAMKRIEGTTGNQEIAADIAGMRMFLYDPVYRRCMANLYLLDLICGQVDRHHGNYIIERDKAGRITGVKGIDNDISFGPQYTDVTKMTPKGGAKLKATDEERSLHDLPRKDKKGDFNRFDFYNGVIIQDLKEIDAEMAKKIIELARESSALERELGKLIAPDEVAAAIGRLRSLAAFLYGLITTNDKRIVSKWK